MVRIACLAVLIMSLSTGVRGQAPKVTFGAPLNLPHAAADSQQMEVQATVDRGGRVHAVWVEEARRSHELYYASLNLPDQSFTAPVKVRDSRGEVQPGVAVRVDESGAIYVVWSESLSTPLDSEIRLAVSEDGKTFGRSVRVSDNPKQKPAGMPSLAVDRGRVYVTWLDGRNYGANRGADLYYAVSSDGGRSFGQFASLFNQVCECNQSLVVSSRFLIAVFRSGFNDRRDIVLRASGDSGNSFPGSMRVSVDAWQTNLCPGTGPLAVFGPQDRLYVVWHSGKENQGDVYFSRSVFENNATSFEPRVRVHTVTQGRQTLPAVAITPRGRVNVAWQDTRGQATRLYLTDSPLESIRFSTEAAPVPLGQQGATPSFAPIPCMVAAPDDSVWIAWTETLQRKKAAYLIKVTRNEQP